MDGVDLLVAVVMVKTRKKKNALGRRKMHLKLIFILFGEWLYIYIMAFGTTTIVQKILIYYNSPYATIYSWTILQLF